MDQTVSAIVSASPARSKPALKVPDAAKVEKNVSKAAALTTDAKWFDEAGKPIWPPNDGFYGTPSRHTLKIGTQIDRYGFPDGQFVSPKGVPFEYRSLPPDYKLNRPLFKYQVVKPIEVMAGPAAPWFGQKGAGMQFKLPKKVQELIDDGSLIEVK